MNYSQAHQQFLGRLRPPPVLNTDGFLLRKNYNFQDDPQQSIFNKKLQIISVLKLRCLVPICYIKSQGDEMELYYECIPRTLESYLVDCDQDQIKTFHRQFIELTIGLAKVGIITQFNPVRCGVVLEHSDAIVKYYLPPEDVTLTHDLGSIEEAVSRFSMEALQYMKNGVDRDIGATLLTSLSQKCLAQSIERDDSPRMAAEERLTASKCSVYESQLRPPLKSHHKNSLRKLSILSKELTQISARHKAKRTQIESTPLQSKLSLESQQSNDGMTRFSDHQHLQTSVLLPKIHPQAPLISSRSKRAQKILSDIKLRMHPYNQILKILKTIKTLS